MSWLVSPQLVWVFKFQARISPSLVGAEGRISGHRLPVLVVIIVHGNPKLKYQSVWLGSHNSILRNYTF